MTLNELKLNESCFIVKISGQGIIKKRLLDLGLTPKTKLTLFKKAPLGDPLELILRGYHLTLRLSDAENIVIELC